ncbi:hypothetical protein BFP97_08990 [Roseivirga sp. 4D4]|uniref:hypothetical protein n=1 Tax=Roseivirga sp. 4D4 TaxID=1889784 RepID=UPI000852BDA5|nr:hypothetical protein [Roseivirga sp. 4D4]OEK01640.1 hypothetical protein BFP97_08990 [Roseivirga sp. 4D4]
MDVTVVIRAAGERTEELCRYIIERQVPKEQVFLIHERPFWKAVKRTFEIGVEEGRKWTLAVDADVLVSSDGIERLITLASKVKKPLFCYQGYVMDFVFGRARDGGPHLYNTSYLKNALGFVKSDVSVLRPESDTYRALAEQGIYTVVDSHLFGLHDYYQFHHDYFRKGYFHSIKSSSDKENFGFLTYWANNMTTFPELECLLRGWLLGKKSSEYRVDIDFFKSLNLEESIDPLKEISSDLFLEYMNQADELSSNISISKLRYKELPKRKLSFLMRVKSWVGWRLISLGTFMKARN